MVDSPLQCDYVTVTRWIALRSGLKGIVTAVAPIISARVHRTGAAGWICVAGKGTCKNKFEAFRIYSLTGQDRKNLPLTKF